GAEYEAQGEHAGGKAVDLDIVPGELRQRHRTAEIEQQDDDELGDAADDRRIGIGAELERPPARQLGAGAEEADHRAEAEADRRNQQRHLGAGDELPAVALEIEYRPPPLADL